MKNDPIAIFKKHGGQLRMSEAIAAGMSRYMLYAMRDRGHVDQVSRGIYRLADLPPLKNPDLATVCLRFPKAVVCLVSALSFHELTTQIPHEISIAVPRETRLPSMDFPPVVAHRFTGEAYEAGIERHDIDGVVVQVYNPEKTIVDCFKFRHRLGLDIVLEALRLFRKKGRFQTGRLVKYARICRVEKIMRPYLEAMI